MMPRSGATGWPWGSRRRHSPFDEHDQHHSRI
jgi:hypothetical protein